MHFMFKSSRTGSAVQKNFMLYEIYYVECMLNADLLGVVPIISGTVQLGLKQFEESMNSEFQRAEHIHNRTL